MGELIRAETSFSLITRTRAARPQVSEPEAYGIAQFDPGIAYQDRLENPDVVLQKFAGGYPGLYAQVRRQLPRVGGACESRKTAVLGLNMEFVPGDPKDPLSVKIARLANVTWDLIPDRTAAMNTLCDGFFDGAGFAEQVWSTVPVEVEKGEWLYILTALRDRPAERFTFDPEGRPRFLSKSNWLRGEEVDPRRLMVLTYGSADTPWGKGEMQDIYSSCWLIDQLQKVGMKAIKRDGQPLIIVWYPAQWGDEQRGKLESTFRARHEAYLALPGDVTEPKIEKLSESVFRSSEVTQNWIDRLEQGIEIRILGAPRSTGANRYSSERAERVRQSERFEKTSTDAAALASAIQGSTFKPYGFLHWFVELNYPGTPLRLRPKCQIDDKPERDLVELRERIDAAQKMGMLVDQEWAAGELKLVLTNDARKAVGADAPQIEQVATPALPENQHKALPPVGGSMPIDDPTRDGEASLSATVKVVTLSGDVVEFAATDLVMTQRGAVAAKDLTDEDELMQPKVSADV